MQRQHVSSSSLRSIGYEADSATLEVEFSSGSVYRYFFVPSAVYSDFMESGSKGGFHAHHIRDRYPYKRID